MVRPAMASLETVAQPTVAQPMVLHCRGVAAAAVPIYFLSLTAAERTQLRGLRGTPCGRQLLLQLPRGGPLQPGEWLAENPGQVGIVQVQAAAEALLQVRSSDSLALLQAAYHLGNRHVALEVHPGELRLLEDPVLAQLLEHRGLKVVPLQAPFQPELGAYGAVHGPSHGH